MKFSGDYLVQASFDVGIVINKRMLVNNKVQVVIIIFDYYSNNFFNDNLRKIFKKETTNFNFLTRREYTLQYTDPYKDLTEIFHNDTLRNTTPICPASAPELDSAKRKHIDSHRAQEPIRVYTHSARGH